MNADQNRTFQGRPRFISAPISKSQFEGCFYIRVNPRDPRRCCGFTRFAKTSSFTRHYPAMSVALSLEGKIALITGGSRGIGAAAVRMFVQAGAHVVFNYQKAEADAEKIVRECGADKCAAIKCNLEGTETAESLIAAT